LAGDGSSTEGAPMRFVGASFKVVDGKPVHLRRKVRALLNKISPDNEARICEHLVRLHLAGLEDFRIVVSLVIEKAIRDPFYSEVYAMAMGQIALAYIADGGGHCDASGSALSFTDLVIEQGRSKFEEFFGSSRALDDGEVGEEELAKTRHRALAYMRLLGHFYLGRLIGNDPLLHCVNILLLIKVPPDAPMRPWPPQAWIECTCELLRTVGMELTKTCHGRAMHQMVMQRLLGWKDARRPHDVQQPGKCNVYPLRIQYLIQDVMEASLRGWPREPCEQKGVPEKAKCEMPSLRRGRWRS